MQSLDSMPQGDVEPFPGARVFVEERHWPSLNGYSRGKYEAWMTDLAYLKPEAMFELLRRFVRAHERMEFVIRVAEEGRRPITTECDGDIRARAAFENYAESTLAGGVVVREAEVLAGSFKYDCKPRQLGNIATKPFINAILRPSGGF